MTKKSKKDRRLEILLNDYNLTNEKIEQFLRSQVNYFISGNVIVFGILGIFGSIKKNTDSNYFIEILYLLPIVILTYLGVIMYHYQRVLALQGYKKYLEESINKIAEQKLVFYGKLGMKFLEKENRFVFFNFTSYILLFLMSIFIAVIATIYDKEQVSNLILYSVIIVTILLLIMFIWAVLRVKNTPSEFYSASLKETKEEL